MARRTRTTVSTPPYYLGRPAADWRRALAPRSRARPPRRDVDSRT